MSTERRNPRSVDIDLFPTERILRIINAEDAMVATAVGVVPMDRIVIGADVRPGDVVIGLPSNGIHSNGLTLARRVLVGEQGPEIGRASCRERVYVLV